VRGPAGHFALAELKRHVGTQFDLECVAALHRVLVDGAARAGRPALWDID
jgi:hypothetical protein